MDNPVISLRKRNQLATMKLVQEKSVTMMHEQGFDETTIEAIAESSGVSASTIYRYFGTKEKIILWDEKTEALDAALVSSLSKTGVFYAFRDSVVTHLAQREDQELFLRRLRLIFAVPAIWSAAAHEDRISRMELADGIARSQRRKKTSLADQLVASCCLAALDIALEAWVDADGKVSLEVLIDQSMAELSKIS
jgi:AcrR family transcriptional regulator